MKETKGPAANPETGPGEPYQPPRIEAILTAEDLEREVLYAGAVSLKQQ